MILLLLLIFPIAHSEGPWDPYCPWGIPGINKALYSCRDHEVPTAVLPQSLQTVKQKVKVGLLFPQTAADCTFIDVYTQGIAVAQAVKDVNSNSSLIPEFELELVMATEYQTCGRTFDTLGYAYTMRVKEKVEVLIGPACGDLSSGPSVASFAASENLPVISVASFQDELNDVTKYPTFTRLYESAEITAYYHASVYQYFGWKEVVTIKEEEDGLCTVKWAFLIPLLRDIIGYNVRSFELDSNFTLTRLSMEDILMNNRVISIFASPIVVRELTLSFYRLCNSFSAWCTWSNYRFLAVNFQIGLVISNEQILPWRCDQSNRLNKQNRNSCGCCSVEAKEDDDEARKAFKSVIYIVSDVPKFSDQDELFCRSMKKIIASPHIKRKPRCIEEVYLIQHVYDTILVYANALHVTKDPTDGRKIADTIKELTNIVGKTGRIITNPQGSRYTEMLAYFLLRESDDEMTSVLRLSPTRETGNYTAYLITGQQKPTRILDTPPCSWHDLKCTQGLATLISGVLVVILAIVGVTVLRIWLDRRRGPRQSFILTPDQLEKLVEANTESADKNFKRVYIKRTDIKVSPTDKNTVAMLRELHHVHHSNIVQLLHCCLDPAGLTLVLEDCPKGPLQYLIRTERRVQTVSFIRSFATDILYGLSYLHGSAFSYHGSLTSFNCVVDANWNVKLKGFYLRHIQEGEVYSNVHEGEVYSNLYQGVELKAVNDPRQVYDKLWMSPEFLKEDVTNAAGGLRKNDVYSFGVILAELINGEPPFGIFFDENIDTKVLYEQIERIKKGEKPLEDDTLQRKSSLSDASSLASSHSNVPEIDIIVSSTRSSMSSKAGSLESLTDESTVSERTSVSGEYSDLEDDLTLIKQFCLLCTQTSPDDRPTVRDILNRLETGSQNYIGTLVDQWLVTLEKKSKELKALFDEKNKNLFKEKERTKELVYSLLPRELAEKKMMGAAVAPQLFSNCSFFYSDIKGFTSIVADLTNLEDGGPMDVVEMLDNLYTIMDRAIGKYNVEKIETIGDAYVVASGLPVPDIDGSAHARHIAAFALEVLSTTKDIAVRRLDYRPVYMRIGIHSGSCVAGVAGTTMFHYCIYGKEPRYANSLESSGEASRIHMSNDMRHILENNYLNKFSFTERKPSVSISGYKTRRTWWLTGEAGVSRAMPDDVIYRNLEFKRKISSTTNPKVLKGIAKLRSDVTGARNRALSESSGKSDKTRRAKSDTISEVSKSASGKKDKGSKK